jgi:hypothetical protein
MVTCLYALEISSTCLDLRSDRISKYAYCNTRSDWFAYMLVELYSLQLSQHDCIIFRLEPAPLKRENHNILVELGVVVACGWRLSSKRVTTQSNMRSEGSSCSTGVLKCSLQQPTCRRSASPSVGCKPNLSLPGWLTRYTVPGKAPYQQPLR